MLPTELVSLAKVTQLIHNADGAMATAAYASAIAAAIVSLAF